MTCTRTRDVGSLVLDLLDPAEAAQLEEHVRTCPECSEAVADLRPVVALMDRADAPAPAPDELAFRRFQAAARPQRRPRRAVLLALVAAAVLAPITAVSVVAVARHPAGTTIAAQQGPVRAQVALRSVDSGMAMSLHLRGVEPGLRCQLVAIAVDGHREVAGTWLASYAGEASVDGTVSLRRSQIARLAVETLDGRTLVAMPVA